MTATQKFVEDAIAGGWRASHGYTGGVQVRSYGVALGHNSHLKEIVHPAGEILIDPLAWQAVGKARGWKCYERAEMYQYERGVMDEEDSFVEIELETWRHRQHRFIDHLADGLTIDEALSAIQ